MQALDYFLYSGKFPLIAARLMDGVYD